MQPRFDPKICRTFHATVVVWYQQHHDRRKVDQAGPVVMRNVFERQIREEVGQKEQRHKNDDETARRVPALTGNSDPQDHPKTDLESNVKAADMGSFEFLLEFSEPLWFEGQKA